MCIFFFIYLLLDIRLVHDLASVGSIQRQGLTPCPSQSWMSSNLDTTHNRANNNDSNNKGQLNTPSQLANEHQDVWAQAHRCFIDAALTQMNEIPSWWPTELKENWRTTLSKLRFTLASERLSNAIQTHLVNVKVSNELMIVFYLTNIILLMMLILRNSMFCNSTCLLTFATCKDIT